MAYCLPSVFSVSIMLTERMDGILSRSMFAGIYKYYTEEYIIIYILSSASIREPYSFTIFFLKHWLYLLLFKIINNTTI